MLRKVISGGQNGADQAGLRVAKNFGVETGGQTPAGWRTLDGARPDLGKDYGLTCHTSDSYVPRTYANAKNSDGTVRLAGDLGSRGEICTLKAIQQYKKPYFDVDLTNPPPHQELVDWIVRENVSVLNIAGNSENTFAGCGEKTEKYLAEVFKLAKEQGIIE